MNSAEAAIGEIRPRLTQIQENIAQACRRAGRSDTEVTLVGVSKGQPLERLQEAWQAGLRTFGENRVQEAAAKHPNLPPQAEWHLIGPLQTNKVRPALDLFTTFHAVDRLKLARALDREAEARNLRPRCFLEVNVGDEASKHGFSAAGLLESLEPLALLRHLDIVGLMAIPPVGQGESDEERAQDARRWFRKLRQLRDEVRLQPGWQSFLGSLSMGMSTDYEVAVEEGATHVRVGTSLFGPRPAVT